MSTPQFRVCLIPVVSLTAHYNLQGSATKKNTLSLNSVKTRYSVCFGAEQVYRYFYFLFKESLNPKTTKNNVLKVHLFLKGTSCCTIASEIYSLALNTSPHHRPTRIFSSSPSSVPVPVPCLPVHHPLLNST